MKEGVKDVQGKLPLNMILKQFPRAFKAVAATSDFGNRKYNLGSDINNWLRVEDAFEKYSDAFMRHRVERLQGNLIDNESGLPHIYHELWNMMATVELYELGLVPTTDYYEGSIKGFATKLQEGS